MELFPPSGRPPGPAALTLTAPARVAPPDVEGSPTYQTFYGLDELPFTLSTDPRFFYHSTVHDHVAQGMLRAIGRHEAIVVMTGAPGLGKTPLREWNRRIATRCRLMPIAADEVGSYIAHRLAVAGTSPRVEFDQTAAARVYEVSGGVPSVINLLCDRTLEEGAKVSASMLDGELVKAAAEGLELSLPSRSSWAQQAALVVLPLVLMLIGGRRRHSCSVPISLCCSVSGKTRPRSPRHLNPQGPSL